MSSLVRSLGYEACLFASAEAFLASPHLGDTSCLIADIQMPGMSGLDLQSELHARQRCIPIIFITAFAEERIRKRAEAAGALGFFSKPVDSQRIMTVARKKTNQSGLRGEDSRSVIQPTTTPTTPGVTRRSRTEAKVPIG